LHTDHQSNWLRGYTARQRQGTPQAGSESHPSHFSRESKHHNCYRVFKFLSYALCYSYSAKDPQVKERLLEVAATCTLNSSGGFHVGNCYGNTINMLRAKEKQAYTGSYSAVSWWLYFIIGNCICTQACRACQHMWHPCLH
jgi:hypothetical protein